MITFTRAYVAKGRPYATLDEAKLSVLTELLGTELAAKTALEHSKQLIDVLTMSDKSRPTARAVNGGKKTRKPKLVAPQLPLPGVPAAPAAA